MIYPFWAGALWFLIFSPLYFFIAVAALGYRVARQKPSEQHINDFLSKLNFPLNKLYVQSRYNIITGSSKRAEAADLLNSTAFGNLLSLIVFASISLLFTVLFGLISLGTKGGAPALFWTVVSLMCLLCAFFFGHTLKSDNAHTL